MFTGVFNSDFIFNTTPIPINTQTNTTQNDQPIAYSDNPSVQAADTSPLAQLAALFFGNAQSAAPQNDQPAPYNDNPPAHAADITPLVLSRLSASTSTQPIITRTDENQFHEEHGERSLYRRRLHTALTTTITTTTFPQASNTTLPQVFNLSLEQDRIIDRNTTETVQTSLRSDPVWVMNEHGEYVEGTIYHIRKRRRKTTVTDIYRPLSAPRAAPRARAPQIPDDQRFEVVDLTNESPEGSSDSES